MGGGSLTEILEQYKYVQLTEPEIAFICFEVFFSLSIIFFFPYISFVCVCGVWTTLIITDCIADTESSRVYSQFASHPP